MYNYRGKKGFSEIELVTFIVLIGVIIVFVHGCQDYSRESKIKADIAALTEYKSVVTAFKDKYGQLPGDFKNAKSVWPDCGDIAALKTNCNGNGDGFWDNNEGYYVFDHLSRAEMLEKTYTAIPVTSEDAIFPTLEVTGQTIVPVGAFNKQEQQNISGEFFDYPLPANSFMVYFESPIAGNPIPTQKKVDPLFLRTLDTKIDDGYGSRGDIRSNFFRIGVFGAINRREQCTDVKGVYKEEEDDFLFCNFIMKY